MHDLLAVAAAAAYLRSYFGAFLLLVGGGAIRESEKNQRSHNDRYSDEELHPSLTESNHQQEGKMCPKGWPGSRVSFIRAGEREGVDQGELCPGWGLLLLLLLRSFGHRARVARTLTRRGETHAALIGARTGAFQPIGCRRVTARSSNQDWKIKPFGSTKFYY